MSVPLELPTAPLARLARRFGTRPWAAAIEAAARAGFVARGAVYLSIGVIALLAALDATPRAEGAMGALEAWGRWPAGLALLWLLGLGLVAFAGWRALQAFADADGCGRSASGLATRAVNGVAAIMYGGFAIAVLRLVDAMGDLQEPSERAMAQALATRVLDLPFGAAALLVAGLGTMAAGLVDLGRAVLDHFARDLDCPPETRTWTGVLARVGHAGRGVAFLPFGMLLMSAGAHARASDARGLGHALDVLARQPFGELALAVTAVGLIAFGLFGMLEAALRPIRVPPEITPDA